MTRLEAVMQTLTAKDVMHAEVLGVRAEMTVREAAGFLTDNQIGGAPVLDGDGRVVGVVSLTDLAENEVERPTITSRPDLERGSWEERVNAEDLRVLHVESDDVLVREIMTPTIYTVPDDTPVAEIARTMIAGRIHRLFVTRQRRLVGIVTPLDLLRLLTGEGLPGEPVQRRTPRKRKSAAAARERRSARQS